MTNKEKAQVLWATLTDEVNPLDVRKKAREELLQLKKAAKTTILKLLGDIVADQHDVDAVMEADLEHDPLEEPAKLCAVVETEEEAEAVLLTGAGVGIDYSKPAKKLKPAIKAQIEGGDIRGLITKQVRQLLLDTEYGYPAIVDIVKHKYPEAKTTTRSVASVASEMRKAGLNVAVRKKGAQA